jgi:hypothetical protein
MNDETPLTISVPQAGRQYFDMSRGASYEAAKRGDIPIVKVGRLLRVPVRALEAMLDNAGSTTTFKKSAAIPPNLTTGSSITARCRRGRAGGRHQHSVRAAGRRA